MTERFALILTQPFRWARVRIMRWIMTRTQRLPGPVRVSRRRIYILPTKFGYTFAALTLVMLLGAMNYSNSMAFALTFLLAALGLVAMHHSHANLVDLSLRGRAGPAVFAGEEALFQIEFENESSRPRLSVGAGWVDHAPGGFADVTAGEYAGVSLALPAPRRGWVDAPRFAVFTEFPLGLFHAWSWVELDLRCLVYPAPAAPGRTPPAARGEGASRSGTRPGHDEFAGLRGYVHGDSVRAIHWKSLPRTATPMVKQFGEALAEELWLDWQELPDLDVESRLSQLTRWVLDASANGARFGLRLPGQELACAQGDAHQAECLRALALFESA